MKKTMTRVQKPTTRIFGMMLGLLVVLAVAGRGWTKDAGKTEWEKTVEAARKEGQVNVYIGGWDAVLDTGAFEKAYPGIKIVGVTGRGSETAKRILAERRAGKYIADVSSEGVGSNYQMLHGANSFDPIKPALMLPEVIDESRWWQGKHRYVDPEGRFVFRFSEMDITLFRDFRQGVDWLASGKFSLCFFCSDIDKAKLQGLPVDEFGGVLKEGAALHTQYGTVALLNRAPNPNAAKVFINWFLSRDGQSTLQTTLARDAGEAPDSLRIDISKDDVKPANRRMEGVRYLDLDSRPEWMDMKPVLLVFEEALAEAAKQKK